MARVFPSSVLDLPQVRTLLEKPHHNLLPVLEDLGFLLELAPRLQEQGITVDIGIYDVMTSHLGALTQIARTFAPECGLAFLCAHGATRVAENLPSLALPPDDWRSLTLYSWCEFDGAMYLQQGDLNGIWDCVRTVAINGGQSLLCNHWRTLENQITIRYLAECSIDTEVSPAVFGESFAARLGIREPTALTNLLHQLNSADDRVTRYLFRTYP